MDFLKKTFKKEPKEEIVEEQPVDVPVMETSPQINLMASDPLLNQTNIEENKIEKNKVLGIEKQLLEKEQIPSVEEEKPNLGKTIPDAFSMSPNLEENIETLDTNNHNLQRTQKFCPECGTPNDVLNKFCVSCGKEI